MSEAQDKIFFRNFSLVVGGIAVMMVIFFTVAHFVVDDDEAQTEMRAAKVAEITAPVGEAVAAGEESASEAAPAAGGDDHPGKGTFNGVCAMCHGVPAMAEMIPQAGDANAWATRVEKGTDTLYDHAINGFVGDMGMMPAKGGNMALTDDEVKHAVDYMLSMLDGADAGATTESADAGDLGKKTFDGVCAMCHGMAAMASMIPQSGDKAAWEARIAKGNDTLYDHALNGFVGDMGMMPAKGGNMNLSEEEVKAAVDYMVGQSQ